MAWTYLMVGDGRMAAGSCQFSLMCVFPRTRAALSLALVLCCPSPLPFSLSLLALLSLQPAWQTGGQATPLRPAGCERWVTEPDNTTNCLILEEMEKMFGVFEICATRRSPPLTNLALMQNSGAVGERRLTN